MKKSHHEQRMAEIQGRASEAATPLAAPPPTTSPPNETPPKPPAKGSLLFLYTDAARIEDGDLALLRLAGFIPIRCASFDDVKVVDPLVAGDRSVIFDAAMRAIHIVGTNVANGEGAKTLLGRMIAAHFMDNAVHFK